MRGARSITVRANRGFTLVELLVVVSIIALLIAILLPSLRKARESAKQTACMANIRGIAQSSLTYAADDPQENGIPAGPSESGFSPLGTPLNNSPTFARLANYSYGGKSGVGTAGGPDVTSSQYGPSAGLNAARRPLNKLMFPGGFKDVAFLKNPRRSWPADAELDVDVYRCPSDTGFQGNHFGEWNNSKLTSYDHFGTSYAANVFWTGLVGGNCKMESNSPYIRPLSRVPNTANTLLYIENVGRYAWQHNDPCPIGGLLPDPPYPEGRGGPKWHQVGWVYNMSFADGHASATKMKGYDLFSAEDMAAMNMTGTCASANCQCIIIRGNGWQLDTLPAATVPSNHTCPASGRPSQDGRNICGWPSGGSCPISN